MTETAATPPDATATQVAAIEDKLAAGEQIEASEVRWLLDALRAATAGDTDATSASDSVRRPTKEELIAEFRLGPDPSPDMLAYLADYVIEREAEAAAEGAQE